MENVNTYLTNCIKNAFCSEECCVETEGTPGKGDGYVGDVYFFKVMFNKANQNETEVHLVAKVSKYVPAMEKFMSHSFNREINFYNEIIPTIRNFQESKQLKEPIRFAKCYKAFQDSSLQVILLQNLKTRGYELHPRNMPMDLNHIKFVLRNYAKFHAISFAFRDQRRDVFNKIENMFDHSLFIEDMSTFTDFFNESGNKVHQDLIEAARPDLAEKYVLFKERGLAKIIKEVLEDIPKEVVVIHGDCNSNNLLFRYKVNIIYVLKRKLLS